MKLSKTSLGFWRALDWKKSDNEILDLVKGCLELGITTFDHADIYGYYKCENLFGNALKGENGLRSKMQLVTKCDIRLLGEANPDLKVKIYDTSKEHIVNSVNRSLKNLNTDYLDVLLIHRPDPLMNADETAEAMDELKKSGKVLEFGVSNFLPHHYSLLQSRLNFKLVTNQIEVSIMHHEHFDNGNVNYLQELRTPPMVWSPFAGGRIFNDHNERTVAVRAIIDELSKKYSCGYEAIASAWLFTHPVNFIVVLGSGNIERIKAAVVGESIKLTKDEWFRLWIAARGQELP